MFRLEFIDTEDRRTETHTTETLQEALRLAYNNTPRGGRNLLEFQYLFDGTLRAELDDDGIYLIFIKEVLS